MARAARSAIYYSEELDRSIVRQMRETGGSYEAHMRDRVHSFFSNDFFNRHFELRFTFDGMEYSFMGYNDDGKIMDMTSNEAFGLYGNGNVHRLKSMLRDRTFTSLNKWGAACQNAVGGNIGSMPLAGRLFAAGVCYEDLILGAKSAREAVGWEVSDLSASEDDGEEMSVSDDGEPEQYPRWMSTGPLVPFSNPATSDESGGATSGE
jgi:hypothetical protein